MNKDISKVSRRKLWDKKSISTAIESAKISLRDNWYGGEICIDTRKIQEGDIFVAFKGENVNGHDYINKAFSNGAVAAIVEYIPKSISGDVDIDHLIVVDDVAKAIGDLAQFKRSRTKTKVIAVTGSVGKTSTKEMLKLALSTFGTTHSSIGNYNNKLGLSIAMSNLPDDAEYAVYELGMDRAGEMMELSRILAPEVAIITTIAPVHLKNFDSVESIAKAKGEIFSGMSKSSIAVLNKSNKFYSMLSSIANKCGLTKLYSFCERDLLNYSSSDGETEVIAAINSKKVSYKFRAYGKHQIHNSIGVLTLIDAIGLDIHVAAKSLEKFSNVAGRGKVKEVVFDSKKLHIIDESYNANPTSMRATFTALSDLMNMDDGALNKASEHGIAKSRKIAVIADMYELGATEIAEHVALCDDIVASKIDKVIAVGKLMKHLFDVLPAKLRLEHFDNYEIAIDNIGKILQNNDTLVIKGSFGTKVHKLVSYLCGQ